MDIPRSLQILREACDANGVDFEVVDDFTGFVGRITKYEQSYLVGAAGIGVFPLNRAAPFAIARDKAFTHYVLEKAGFCVPAGGYFFVGQPGQFQLPPGKTRKDGSRFAERLSDNFARPLVVKPNSGKGAKRVSLVRSRSALEMAFDAIAEVDEIALVQSLVDAPEFRLFLIDGEIAFAYRKSRPKMKGDGLTSVAGLWKASALGDTPPHYLLAQLEREGLSLTSVLEQGRTLEIDFVANLAAGGNFDGFLRPAPAISAWARRLAKTVGLRVTGIDVFSHSGLADPNDIIVTDVNGSPNLSTLHDLGHRALVMDVWRLILEKAFARSWPEGF